MWRIVVVIYKWIFISRHTLLKKKRIAISVEIRNKEKNGRPIRIGDKFLVLNSFELSKYIHLTYKKCK